MPSSVVLVALVVCWFVVLVPMVARHRQQLRRVGGPALSTRVLHRGGQAVAAGRRGPAAGHPSDPTWRDHEPPEEDVVSDHDTLDDGYDTDEHDTDEHDQRERETVPPRRRGRGGFDPEADAVARHARYAVRQRVVLGLAGLAVLTAVLALSLSSTLWWAHLLVDAALVGYLVYLRAQVRIEQDVRERRMHRIDRARLGVSSAAAERDDELPPRLRRPGAVVVEIADEDPAFYEMDEYAPAPEPELRRASGQ